MPKTKPELKGKLKRKGKRAKERTQVIKIVVQTPTTKASKPAPFKTGMNRDIPLGGAGGSPNLLANLLASRQAQPAQPAQIIQTPDQFNIQQDIKNIKEDIQKQRQRREYPIDIPEGEKVKIKVKKELEPDAQIIGQQNKEYSAGGANKEKVPLKQKPNAMSPEQLAQDLYNEHGITVDYSHSLRGMESVGANPTNIF